MISLGSIIGSGWLLGALTAAKVAGAASLVSWVIGGLVLALLALVHAERGSTYPVSGGTARFPFMIFGALGGFTGGWMAWIQAVTIAPIEVEATIGKGIALGAAFMLVFTIINTMGVRWLAETNSIATYWKILVPTITIFALLFSVFHTSNFTAGGGFVPYARGNRRHARRHHHLPAARGGLRGGTAAVEPGEWLGDADQRGGHVRALRHPGHQAGLGWLATLLIIDAVVSPAGTGLIYIGTSSRLSYGLGRNGYFPKIISKVSSRGVPLVSIIICFVVGMLTFRPFPSWAGLVGLVTSATVIMYAMAPVSLAGLRRKEPDRPRAYRLPAAGVLCPVAFICANCIVYFSGFSTLVWLYFMIAFGFVIFAIYQATRSADQRTIIEWRSSYWILPWLAGLLIISWQGRYDASSIFGLTLVATERPERKVAEAVESVEEEASVELEVPLA